MYCKTKEHVLTNFTTITGLKPSHKTRTFVFYKKKTRITCYFSQFLSPVLHFNVIVLETVVTSPGVENTKVCVIAAYFTKLWTASECCF